MESFWQLRLTESFTSVIYGRVAAAETTQPSPELSATS